MKTAQFFVLGALGLYSCSQPTPNNADELKRTKEVIEEIAATPATEIQLERKNKSLAICKDWEIPTSENLPVIQSDEATTLRTHEEVIERALVLGYLGLKSEGLEQHYLDEYESKYAIAESFSPVEMAFKHAEHPSQQQMANANWRYESLHVLLWSIGLIDSLSHPGTLCDVGQDMGLLFQYSKQALLETTKLRTKSELLDQADLIYRIHWACVDARITNQPTPGDLNSSVVYERHYVLNWLINYADQDWDNVSTDT